MLHDDESERKTFAVNSGRGKEKKSKIRWKLIFVRIRENGGKL